MSAEPAAGAPGADAGAVVKSAAARRRKWLVKGALCVALGLAIVGALLSQGGGRAWVARAIALVERIIAYLQAGGPWLFFGGMALLPAVGMPMMAFSLTAGPAFAPTLGVGGAVAAALAAATVNLLLTYGLARHALRPVLERLMERFGYRLPELETRDSTDLIVVLRVTPGIPFFAQNYLLGLADAPVGWYLGISCAVVWTYTSGLIVFGDALRRGSAKTAVSAIAVVVAAGAVTHFIRRHYAGRKPVAKAPTGP